MKYDLHPSERLVELFRRKPYQGQSPDRSSVLIIGNDANYSDAISKHAFFESILEYHVDGVAFWTTYEKHHPFLLSDYPFDRRIGGVRYHSNFAKMRIASRYAADISFVELLDVPTVGNTGSNRDLFFRLLSREHLEWLEDLIFVGRAKFILVNRTLAAMVERISRRYNALRRLSTTLCGTEPGDSVLLPHGSVIYNGYSFSHSISNAYIEELGRTVKQFMGSRDTTN